VQTPSAKSACEVCRGCRECRGVQRLQNCLEPVQSLCCAMQSYADMQAVVPAMQCCTKLCRACITIQNRARSRMHADLCRVVQCYAKAAQSCAELRSFTELRRGLQSRRGAEPRRVAQCRCVLSADHRRANLCRRAVPCAELCWLSCAELCCAVHAELSCAS
jgi:hypothetical protein